jgi:membrane associated rhomboid family serine protease
LYRPHHAANAAPARFKMGVICEMIYPPKKHKNPKKPWTAEDEAEYDAKLFKISMKYKTGPKSWKTKALKLPLPCFLPNMGMFLCAKIVRYDKQRGTYTLEYAHGPYLPDEYPDGTKALGYKKHPDAVFVIENVQPDLVSVDMNNNYGSHTPRFIFGITVIQVAVFVYYVFYLGADQYEAGPELWWMKTIDVFPKCGDLRGQYWRLLSYQLVHSGFEHIIFNALMQCLFGLPINMVHGDLKFFVMYELGVIGGSMNWVLIDGGQGGLVGASGGVYAVFGINAAEIIMNWESNSKGLITRWGRLGMVAFVIGIDIFLYFTGGSNEHLSNAAHGETCVEANMHICCWLF